MRTVPSLWFSAFFLLATTAACTPVTQPYTPLTQSPQFSQSVLLPGTGEDALPLRHWLPTSTPCAVIVAVHGFNDYSKAFELPGDYLSRHGIAVYAYDQRGFGATGQQGIWAGEENYTRDLAQMVRAVKKKYKRTPLYLMGESMGGAVVITALSDADFPKVQGAILVSPAVWGGNNMSIVYRSTLWALAHIMPGGKLTGQGLHIQATDNIPLLRKMGRDTLIIKETRMDAIYGIVNLMNSAYQKASTLKTPLFILYGAHDQVIPPAPVVHMVRNLTTPEVTMAVYPDNYHMMLRDLEGEIPQKDIASWVLNRKKPLPSHLDMDWEERLKKKK